MTANVKGKQMNDRMTSLLLAAFNAMHSGNVVRVDRKPGYGVAAEFIDAGIRTRSIPMVITHFKSGKIERAAIAPGSKLHCAMNARSISQVLAISKQSKANV